MYWHWHLKAIFCQNFSGYISLATFFLENHALFGKKNISNSFVLSFFDLQWLALFFLLSSTNERNLLRFSGSFPSSSLSQSKSLFSLSQSSSSANRQCSKITSQYRNKKCIYCKETMCHVVALVFYRPNCMAPQLSPAFRSNSQTGFSLWRMLPHSWFSKLVVKTIFSCYCADYTMASDARTYFDLAGSAGVLLPPRLCTWLPGFRSSASITSQRTGHSKHCAFYHWWLHLPSDCIVMCPSSFRTYSYFLTADQPHTLYC